jgi:signal transduction histidine kinase
VVTLDDVTEEVHREEILIQQERLASIGLLASGVAHEVNTPLTGISSYAQMLLEETDPSDPRYGLLKRIEQQSFRASDIANRLLNFSRPDRHGFVGVDLNDLVEETLSLFEPQLRGCKIFVRREVDDDLPAVLGHRGKLQQVLLNLLLNARDAMAQGGEIWVRTAAEPGGVRVEVQDTGEGIRPEILGRIYDPFFTTKGPGKGTGLGLSIAYGIVQEHSGRLTVDSRPGEGSRFTIHLPREHRSRLAAN